MTVMSSVTLLRALLHAVASLLIMVTSFAARGADQGPQALEQLGRSLFFDTAFSPSRSQSCATCHDPAAAFIDARTLPALDPVSLGSNGLARGVRNAPTLGYVALTPEFAQHEDGGYVGGFFLDGRAPTLEAQASVPLLHPDEMAMASADAVLERLLENPQYVQDFKQLFGPESLQDGKHAIKHFSAAIAAFERSDEFAPFDSKYDRYLQGDYQPTVQEQIGMALFFTPDFTSCNQCHQLKSLPNAAGESFSNYRYENIGVPANPRLLNSAALQLQGSQPESSTWRDEGLAANPEVVQMTEAHRNAQRGKFKVPTLRNIALTAPYMHNGVFQELRTVLQFYNKFNAFTQMAQTDPETGQIWAPPETGEDTVALDKLRALFLTEPQINALLAFLEMLTDQRYEHLLNQDF